MRVAGGIPCSTNRLQNPEYCDMINKIQNLEDAMESFVSQDQLKELVKAAIAEVLEERRDLLRDVIEEAMEDIALSRAIEEGEGTEIISRDAVFNLLKVE